LRSAIPIISSQFLNWHGLKKIEPNRTFRFNGMIKYSTSPDSASPNDVWILESWLNASRVNIFLMPNHFLSSLEAILFKKNELICYLNELHLQVGFYRQPVLRKTRRLLSLKQLQPHAAYNLLLQKRSSLWNFLGQRGGGNDCLLVAREEAVTQHPCQRTVPYLELTLNYQRRLVTARTSFDTRRR
jgi:hypothetical protein